MVWEFFMKFNVPLLFGLTEYIFLKTLEYVPGVIIENKSIMIWE